MSIEMYFSSVSGNTEIKKNQQKIVDILESKKIDFEKIDISANDEKKNFMKENATKENVLPPQLFKGGKYLGDIEDFNNAIEDGVLEAFLELPAGTLAKLKMGVASNAGGMVDNGHPTEPIEPQDSV